MHAHPIAAMLLLTGDPFAARRRVARCADPAADDPTTAFAHAVLETQ
jgi:hypothetical protein